MRNRLPVLLLCLCAVLASATTLAYAATPGAPVGDTYLPLITGGGGTSAPVLKWQRGGCFNSWCQTGWYSSPAVADLDGDGSMEVVAAAYDLVILDGATGALEHRAGNGSRAWPGIVVADIDGNDTLEIVVGRGSDQLTVYNADGSERWTRNPFGSGEVRTLATADIDKDGEVELVVGRASGGSTRQLSIYEPDGHVRDGWPARRDGEAGYGWGMYNQNAAVADLTGDGYAEIVGPTDTHYITALDRDGNQVPAHARYNNYNPRGPKVWSQVGVHVEDAVDLRGYADCGVEHRPNFANSAPAIADLDGDGTREIVVVGNVYDCGADPYESLYEMPFIFNADRSRWASGAFDWTAIPATDTDAAPLSEDYNVIESAPPNPVIADLDGDGVPEILHASYDGRLHAWWLDKTEHGAWPYSVYDVSEGFFRFASEPVVADLENDGRAEVLFTSWPEKGGNRVGKVHVLDAFGSVLFEVDLPAPFSGEWNGGLAAPTIANIDADTEYELVINTAHSGVVAYDLPGSSNARILWATGRGSYLRSGSK